MIVTVEKMIRELDPDSIVQRTFFDEASRRLFVTVLNGRRKTDITLPQFYFQNGSIDKVRRAVEQGIKRLQTTPQG